MKLSIEELQEMAFTAIEEDINNALDEIENRARLGALSAVILGDTNTVSIYTVCNYLKSNGFKVTLSHETLTSAIYIVSWER